jgi:predicted DNA-binding transcriptional regulator AlpA
VTGPLVVVSLEELQSFLGREFGMRLEPVLAAIDKILREQDREPAGDPARLLDRRQVADRLGIHPRSLRRLILQREFPKGVSVGAGGRALRWEAAQVDEFIRRRSLPL